ncbi:RNA polymerase sigma factor [Melittangium boletus]|uniref:RNA polymerase sigma factor n=1 Tax=Melittangium boletus TaxID=83453 RepID=UPI003DA598B2
MSQKTLKEIPFEDLIVRARAGESGALDELLRRSDPRVKVWTGGKRIPGGESPSDISQGVLMDLRRIFAAFTGQTEAQWFGFLKKAVRNHKLQLIRGARAQKRAPSKLLPLEGRALRVPARDTRSSQSELQREKWHLGYTYVFSLPEDQRTAVYLRHIKGLPIAEIMAHMGCSKGSVEGLLARGRARLGVLSSRRQSSGDGEAPPLSDEAQGALATYFQLSEEGRAVAPEAFIADYPACAEVLRDLIHWLEQLRDSTPDESETTS